MTLPDQAGRGRRPGQGGPATRHPIAALKVPFTLKVRTFDEARRTPRCWPTARSAGRRSRPTRTIRVFRDKRKALAPLQGQERTTWVQAVLIGDVAIVGVPAEFFTVLGQDIKRRSPFRYTYVFELAND